MSNIDELIAKYCPNGVRFLALKDVAQIKNGKDYKHLPEGNIPVYGSGGVMTHVGQAVYEGPSVLLPRKGSISNVFYVDEPFWNVDTIYYTVIDQTIMMPRFFYHFMLNQHIERLNTSNAARPALTQAVLNKIIIPVPPLPVQEEIVRILDSFSALEAELEAELEARRKQYAHYRDELLKFDRERVQWLDLGSIAWVGSSRRILKQNLKREGIPFFRGTEVGKLAEKKPISPEFFIDEQQYAEVKQATGVPQIGDLLLPSICPDGRVWLVNTANPFYLKDARVLWIRPNQEKIDSNF